MNNNTYALIIQRQYYSKAVQRRTCPVLFNEQCKRPRPCRCCHVWQRVLRTSSLSEQALQLCGCEAASMAFNRDVESEELVHEKLVCAQVTECQQMNSCALCLCLQWRSELQAKLGVQVCKHSDCQALKVLWNSTRQVLRLASLASMAGGHGQQRPQQPSVLHQLYPGISSLKEALLRLVSAHGLHEHLALELVHGDDPAAYSKALLDSVLVSVASNAPPLPQRFSLQQHSSQAEVCCTLWLFPGRGGKLRHNMSMLRPAARRS